jgi:hypothetical protein
VKSGLSTVGVAVTVALALAVTIIHGQAQGKITQAAGKGTRTPGEVAQPQDQEVQAQGETAQAQGETAQAQGTEVQAQRYVARRGGPRDWSHGRVIAARFGPDLDRNIDRDWRTVLKHAQLDRVRAHRDARGLRQATIDWFDGPIDWLDGYKPFGKQKASQGAHLDWNLRTGGYGSVVGYPAKYSFEIAANNCSDVIYYTVDQTGAAAAPNVIAITNPYAPCPGNAGGATPTVKFGLRLPFGTATSPVPNYLGTILYVIESRPLASGGMILHAINVNNATIASAPGTYDFGTTNWSNAHTLVPSPTGSTREQLFQITFATVTNDLASPYLDYVANQLFFGDSTGYVHRVTNVDTATPTSDPGNFPIRCGTQALQSPVFVNGQVIVTSADGRLYRIDTTLPSPTCIASAQRGAGTSVGEGGGLSAPVVDVSNNRIIVVGNYTNGVDERRLRVFDLMFSSGASEISGAFLGDGSTSIAPMAPAFDEAFWSTNNGNIYASGRPSSGNGTYLIRVPYNGLNLGTPSGFATLNNTGAATVATSPVTEFLTASSLANPDFLFVGGTTGNYGYINRISSGFGGTNGSPVAMNGSFNPVGSGGVTSGIVIDTRTAGVIGATATANVYFGTEGVPSSSRSSIVQLAQQF